MKKSIIIVICCVFLATISINLFVQNLMNKALIGVAEEDVLFLESLEFKTVGFGTDVAFTSQQFDDLEIGINQYAMYGYESHGTRYGDYVVSGGFYKDGKTIDYRFDVFPYEISDESNGNDYIISTDHLLSEGDELWVSDPELIDLFNQFILRVEPVVTHDYQTDFEVPDDYDLFTEYKVITSYPVVSEVQGYKQYDCDNCGNTYVKDSAVYEIRDKNNFFINDYDFENSIVSQYYLEDGYLQYSLIEESDIDQEIYIGETPVQIEYLDDDVINHANQLIDELNKKYDEAKAKLLE
ncbi:hypothetical protein R2F61_08685 [Mollicutes bacterium LVI A0078]|nr:hypothetical protein RZE84_08460 [Mollicutes bacterium LVI A0075]WOO90776.1 hypothetical protein R2F61_08685 [Mollicutes bacterium LVI A0078]